ncbi:MAG: hypothetical protein M3R08_07220, partial [Bacteroidota bacterium]|nr:hypothetical protein [Bacteroidota bacterium]
MMAHYRIILLAGIGSLLLLASCGSPQEIGGTEVAADTLQATPRETEILSIGGRSFSIPSPVQAALAIRKSGSKYQKDLTTPLEEVDQATGKMTQAALLGIYSADLAYVTVHSDGQRAMATFQAIEKLGTGLELSNAFDRKLMDQFKTNLNNEDSLLRFSSKAFRAADKYLKTNQREDVSTWILTGGWIQSLHLSLADSAGLKDQKLIDRIGDQKASLDALIELLTNTDSDRSADPLINVMRELRNE